MNAAASYRQYLQDLEVKRGWFYSSLVTIWLNKVSNALWIIGINDSFHIGSFYTLLYHARTMLVPATAHTWNFVSSTC